MKILMLAQLILFFTSLATQANTIEIQVVTEDAYPLQYESKGEIVGSATALMKEVLDQAQISYSIEILPWARAYQTALHRKNVLIYSITRNKDREPLFNWIGKIMDLNYFLYGLESTKIDKNAPLQVLKNYRIAVSRGGVVHQYLRKKSVENLHVVTRKKQEIELLQTRRVDFMVGVEGLFYESCMREKLNCTNLKPLYRLKEPSTAFYFALSKSTDLAVVEKIQKAYQAVMMKKSQHENR